MDRSGLHRRFIAVSILAAASAACATIAHRGPPVDVHSTMIGGIDPAAVAIWSLSSRAMGEASGSRTARMDIDAWNGLEASARQLSQSARSLAEAPSINVGNYTAVTEGFASQPEVQARIDADTSTFRQLAEDAATHSDRLAAAARARDIPQTQALTKSLYDNCLACHSRYWKKPR